MFFLLLGLTVFLGITGIAFAMGDGGAGKRRAALERIRRSLGEGAGGDAGAFDETALSETKSDLSSILSGAAQRIRFLRGIDLLLYQAGRPMSLVRFIGACIAGVVLGGMITLTAGAPYWLALGILPPLYIWRKKQSRMRKFDSEFPQALALFSRALRAGHGLTAGFQMVGDSLSDPVSTEFALVAREISLGLDAGTAIANLQDRVDSADLPIFTTAVLVQLETGGNLAEVLDNLAETIRERISFGGKVKALTSQSRMSANILAALPFGLAMLLNVFDPDYMKVFFEDPTGRMLAMVTVASVSFGFFLCRRLARVEA